jgi:hypothetical protein
MDDNPLKLKGLHHMEFLVGNARQAADFYKNALRFSLKAYAGLETGRRESASYVLKQGTAIHGCRSEGEHMFFVLTTLWHQTPGSRESLSTE